MPLTAMRTDAKTGHLVWARGQTTWAKAGALQVVAGVAHRSVVHRPAPGVPVGGSVPPGARQLDVRHRLDHADAGQHEAQHDQGQPSAQVDPPAEPMGVTASAQGYDETVTDSSATLKVLVYSDDVNTRQQVILALGRRPHPDLPELEYVEVATEPVVLQNMDRGDIALAILDGEAVPAGGMGIAKQLKDEIYQCPPVVVLTGRPQDAWLATWSRAEAAVPHPIDPIQLAEAVIGLLRPSVPATS